MLNNDQLQHVHHARNPHVPSKSKLKDQSLEDCCGPDCIAAMPLSTITTPAASHNTDGAATCTATCSQSDHAYVSERMNAGMLV